jgi:DNA polymerase III epsilon subunit-like protein
VAREAALLLDGSTLVAANPTFDAGFLTAFLNEYHQAATWHYRLRDIGSMTWGFLAGQRQEGAYIGDLPPMDASTDELAAAGLGIDLSRFERHSALGDVRLLAAMLDAIEGAS